MYTLDLIKSIRKQFEELVSTSTLEELNTIPKGFNNNIAWNYGHIVVSGYGLTFVSTGVNPSANNNPLVAKFRKGSKPEGPVTQQEMDAIKELAANYPVALEESIKEDKFQNITPYTSQTFGIPMTTLDSVLTTIASHDMLHFQTAKMYKRILNTQS